MSALQEGISVVVKNSIFEDTVILVDDSLALRASGLSTTSQADGGYWSANVQFQASEAEVSDWISQGVGRDITFHNAAGVVVWNGIVNSVSADWGGLSLKSGDFLELANQVTVNYQAVTYNTNPPVGGSKQTVTDAIDLDSQGRYGVQAEVVNAGAGGVTDAEQYRDRFIAERAFPDTSVSFSLQNSNSPSITIECVGYAQLLSRPLYGTSATGRVNASAKVSSLFALDPNGIFPDTSAIDENTLQVPAFENGEKRLFEVLQSTTALGDASFNRWISGIGAIRKPYYREAVQEVTYTYLLADTEPRIEGKNRSYVFPWDVQAGKWMFLSGVLENLPTMDDFSKDPRYIFIEDVSWSAVWGLDINGGRVFKSSQILAQMGLGGSS